MWNPLKKEELDAVIESPFQSSFLKKGKYCFRIIYEDTSFRDYYKKIKNDYTFRIKKHTYVIVPDSITFGKNPTLTYYYNNPFPIKFRHKKTKITALSLQPKDSLNDVSSSIKQSLATTYVDSSVLDTLISSDIIRKIFSEGQFTLKTFLIIFGVIVLVVGISLLIWAQMTGRIDIRTMFSGGTSQAKGMFIIGGSLLLNKLGVNRCKQW